MRMILRHLLIICVLAGCSRPASKTPSGTDLTTGSAPRISINSVQVNQGAGVYITGTGTLPNGACVKTDLLADSRPVSWWPRDICIEIENGHWEMLAALGRGGAPNNLEAGINYEVQAWWPEDPEKNITRFPLDLTGPKPPP